MKKVLIVVVLLGFALLGLAAFLLTRIDPDWRCRSRSPVPSRSRG